MANEVTMQATELRWDETTYASHEGGTLARAEVATAYTGDLEGEGLVTYLMAAATDGSGTFVGFERVEGVVDGRAGGFVLRHEGSFDAAAVRAELTVVPGSGSKELKGIVGAGSFIARHADEGPFEVQFTYELEEDAG